MRKVLIPLVCLVLALFVAACGDDDSGSGGSAGGSGATKAPEGAKQGGTLTKLNLSDVDSLDPAYWYYQEDYQTLYQTTQRALYGWEPDKTVPSPDLAEGPPEISDDKLTATIKIKKGIMYSAPYSKEVVAADFKYQLERCADPKFGNGYAGSYLSDIKGFAEASEKGVETGLSGVEAVDDHTLKITFENPAGAGVIESALALPCGVPVPKSYAAEYDKGKNPTYGQHQVFTGPYMIENDGKGKLTGYQPGKRITLVRNPAWKKDTDYRPAYLDKIIVDEGNDISVASRKVLTGTHMISGDYAAPPPEITKQALTKYKSQISVTPSQGSRFFAFNTQKPPFDDVNVRRAALAATDRDALRLLRGGKVIGELATHFLPPGIGGHEEAGGLKGPGFDFMGPKADIAVAEKYLKEAGFSSGKYEGPELLMVADNEGPAQKGAQAWKQQLETIGFKIKLREVPHEVMYSKYCNVPKNQPELCPSLGWGKDFFDAQSFMDPLFNSKNIVPSGNINWSQVKDPKVDKFIADAKAETDTDARNQIWAEMDKYVTDQALYNVWLWDNQIQLASKDVNVVLSKFNTTADLTFTSLK